MLPQSGHCVGVPPGEDVSSLPGDGGVACERADGCDGGITVVAVAEGCGEALSWFHGCWLWPLLNVPASS